MGKRTIQVFPDYTATSMDLSFYLLELLIIHLSMIKYISTVCLYPTAEDIGDMASAASVVKETTKDNYTAGELVLFQCSKSAGGFGVVVMYCEEGDTWSAPNRSCDQLDVDNGSLFGILVAIANLAIAVGIMAYSKMKFGARAKIMEALAMAEKENDFAK